MMKRNYVECDICGRKLSEFTERLQIRPWFPVRFRFGVPGMSFEKWDLCNRCARKLKQAIRTWNEKDDDEGKACEEDGTKNICDV